MRCFGDFLFLLSTTILSTAAARRSKRGKACGRAAMNDEKGMLTAKPAKLAWGADVFLLDSCLMV